MKNEELYTRLVLLLLLLLKKREKRLGSNGYLHMKEGQTTRVQETVTMISITTSTTIRISSSTGARSHMATGGLDNGGPARVSEFANSQK